MRLLFCFFWTSFLFFQHYIGVSAEKVVESLKSTNTYVTIQQDETPCIIGINLFGKISCWIDKNAICYKCILEPYQDYVKQFKTNFDSTTVIISQNEWVDKNGKKPVSIKLVDQNKFVFEYERKK
jgi:hypothetical protein